MHIHTQKKRKIREGTLRPALSALISEWGLDSIAVSTFLPAIAWLFCQMQYPWQAHSPLTFWAFRIHLPETHVVPKNLCSLDSDNKKGSTESQSILIALSKISTAHNKSRYCLVPLPQAPPFPWQELIPVLHCMAWLWEEWRIFKES